MESSARPGASSLPGALPPPGASSLPDAEQLPDALLGLAVPFEDVEGLLAARRRVARDHGLRAEFEETLSAQAAAVGTVGCASGLWGGWPEGSDGTDYLSALLFVALAPHTRAYHRSLGVPPEVTRATLADLGRHLALSRRRGRSGGLRNPSWQTLHFRGELFQLGRLQFQRKRFTGPADEASAAGPGAWFLELHVPGCCGPLSPGACDRSLALARAFFARHFPAEPYRTARIGSWLLDPQLARYLPADSNIVRFQQRFTPLDPPGLPGRPGRPEDDDPLGFVFGDSRRPLAGLPRDTTLQRALVDHLLAGGHWYVVGGWLRL
ncbi:acyltransferase domain-containing protein [Kitasatospora sp. NPDC047058]|uniref:acyltransferase domain-containing protein n=1 Tax=Kitasatospora sp. NPDC047058 TaxID=3155620 RepID=UPI0033F9E881